jgi:alpha-L-rhamnosidase/Glycosyl hydrolases family 2, sugar binding domain
MKTKHLIPFIAAALHAIAPGVPATSLEQAFVHPPPDTRPGCYWYWINDNVSKQGITRDLEAMARVGIGRAYIGHIFGQGERWETPVGNVPFMSDAWWDALQWAVKEADRCGVEIGFFNSPGWSQSGGPWVKPSQSMRYLAASETVIEGGRRIDQMLPVPEITTAPMAGGSKPEATGPKFTQKDFQDVRVIAFKQPESEANDFDMARVKCSSPDIKAPDALLDHAAATSIKIGPKPRHIDFELDGTTPVQSLRIDPLDQLYTLTCLVAASDDGKTFREVARHVEQRGHQGPRNKDPMLIPFPETKARHLRVTLSASRDVPVAGLALSRRAVVAHHVRKQLGETSPSVRPPWDSYIWPTQSVPSAGSVVDSTTVVDLTDKMDAHGKLVWDAPPGRWVVMRAGMIPIGTQCAPASPQSRGLEVDKMSKEHVRALFDGMVGEFLRRTPPQDRKALKYVIADSYETGPQNWTDGMVEKFEKRFGYPPVRFLPCLSGRVIDSPEVSTRFLWDWRRLIAEAIATEYVGGLREVSNRHGLTLWLENYGHWGFPSEFLLYGSMSDQVGGEFWESGDPISDVECRAAASCSHIYGRTDVYAEAFTSNRSFEQSPASFKTWCDWIYGTGVNHHILHVYIHQPDERKPGITAWFGTAFNRHNTWFEPSKAFIDYTRRNSVLLKAGLPVIDVAYYIGENAPSMEGPRDPALPDGYDFDYINSDVLIHRAKVLDGRITVPNGPSYAVLVLPKQSWMRPEVAEAIRRLVRDGAHVIGPKPTISPSLAGYPQCDQDLTHIANDVWGSVDGRKVMTRKSGKGMIHDGVDLVKVLGDLGVPPDVSVVSDSPLPCAAAGAGKIGIGKKGGIVFKHRSTADRGIYFLSNTSDQPVGFTASLRVTGRQPELWNADTGTIVKAAAFTQRDGRTLVPLRLDAAESIYVVFKDPITADAAGTTSSNSPEFEDVAILNGPWTVRFDGQGAPKETVFDTLTDWSKHPDETIRQFSGTGVYETHFTLTEAAKDRRTMIALGKVADIATVVINGREAGTAWTTPWEIDISDSLKAGNNSLQIRVVNSWHNRLVADAALPPGQRLSYASMPYRTPKDKPLQSSGLLGPVKIKQSPVAK